MRKIARILIEREEWKLLCVGEEDMQESYFRWLEEHPEKALEEEEFEYDEEGNVIIKKRVTDT